MQKRWFILIGAIAALFIGAAVLNFIARPQSTKSVNTKQSNISNLYNGKIQKNSEESNKKIPQSSVEKSTNTSKESDVNLVTDFVKDYYEYSLQVDSVQSRLSELKKICNADTLSKLNLEQNTEMLIDGINQYDKNNTVNTNTANAGLVSMDYKDSQIYQSTESKSTYLASVNYDESSVPEFQFTDHRVAKLLITVANGKISRVVQQSDDTTKNQ